MKTMFILVLALTTSIFMPEGVFCDERPAKKTIHQAKDTLEASRLLVDGLSEFRLRDLPDEVLQGNDSSLAIAAYFDRFVRSSKVTNGELVLNIGRFAGFIEGKMKVRPPTWWVTSLVNSRREFLSFPEGRVYHYKQFAVDLQIVSDSPFKLDSTGLWQRAKRVVSHKLFAELRTKFDDKKKYVAICLSADRLFVGFYSDFGFSYSIVCVDLQKETIIWQTDVWAGAYSGATGVSHHYVEFVVSNGDVFVFGGDPAALYLESFDSKDGSPRLRFRTKTWH